VRKVSRALITDGEGRLLLAKRAANDRAGGEWCALGGKIDFGETPDEAVARETFEEAGLTLSGLKLYTEHTDNGWRTYFFEASASGEHMINPDEHSEVAYFSSDELDGVQIAFNHLSIFKAYLSERYVRG
jgi:8-oxo-dGTP diphosphatase